MYVCVCVCFVSAGQRDRPNDHGTVDGSGERAAVPAVRVRRHRDHGQVGVPGKQRAGVGDAKRDGSRDGRAGRVPRGVDDRPSRRGVRVAVDQQGITVHGRREPNVNRINM